MEEMADDNLRAGVLNKLLNPKIEDNKNTELPDSINEVVIPQASYKSHYGDVIGVFFYNILTGELDYRPYRPGLNHDDFGRFKEYNGIKGMARGRLFKDDNKVVIYFHTDDYYPFKASQDVLNDLYKKVEEISKTHVNHIVDESGRNLLEKKEVNTKGIVEQCLEHQLAMEPEVKVDEGTRQKILENIDYGLMGMFKKK